VSAEYVDHIVAKYQVDTRENSQVYQTAMAFKTLGEEWAGQCLRFVTPSG